MPMNDLARTLRPVRGLDCGLGASAHPGREGLLPPPCSNPPRTAVLGPLDGGGKGLPPCPLHRAAQGGPFPPPDGP